MPVPRAVITQPAGIAPPVIVIPMLIVPLVTAVIDNRLEVILPVNTAVLIKSALRKYTIVEAVVVPVKEVPPVLAAYKLMPLGTVVQVMLFAVFALLAMKEIYCVAGDNAPVLS